MAKPEYLAGMLRVLILSEMSRGPGYGWGIAQALSDKSGGDLAVRPESLYPVLHRMEQEGLLDVRWEEAENGRPRKIYSITPKGRKQWERSREGFVRQSQGALKALGIEPEAAQP